MASSSSTNLDHRHLHEPVLKYIQTEFVRISEDETVQEALDTFRACPIREGIVYFYVLDDLGHLKGVVPTRRFLASPPNARIGDIMVADPVVLPSSATVLDACELFVARRFLSLPVVNEHGAMMGVLSVSLFAAEILDSAGRHASDNLFQLIGVHANLGRRVPLMRSFADRFPWLMANIGGGIACAIVGSLYEDLLDKVIVLALFIPVVLALAESVSIQSMTITFEGLLDGQRDRIMFMRALLREFLVAILLGLGCGGIMGIIGFLWLAQWQVAMVLASAITLSMITACMLGIILPTLMHWSRGNARIASGPLVLASTDILTLLLYFNIAMVMFAGIEPTK